MRFPASFFAPTALVLVLAAGTNAHAAGIRLVSSDDHGVTLRLDVPDPTLAPAGPDGRSRILSDLGLGSSPGRPQLPYAATLIALPPGTRPVVTLVGGEDEKLREGVRLTIGGRPGFNRQPGSPE